MKRVGHFLAAAFCTLLLSATVLGQTNPVAQTLPYSQDFGGLSVSSTTYPAGWQGWTIASVPAASYTTGGPTADQPLTASGTAASTGLAVYNYNGKLGYLNTGAGDITIALAINTNGFSSVQVQYDIETIRNPYDGGSNTRINEVSLQYRVGTSGVWTTIAGAEYQNSTITQTIGTTPQNPSTKSLTLPPPCDNQPVVQLRWASRQVGGAGSRPSFAVDNLTVNGTATTDPSTVMFRSAASGNWNAAATWETSNDGTNWSAAAETPTSASGAINIRAGHTVTVTSSVAVDQVIVDAGGQITINAGTTLTVADGAGTDLSVNGNLLNAGTLSQTGTMTFGGGSKYQHAQDGGSGPSATWNAASTFEVTGWVNSTSTNLFSNSPAYGNVTWNSPAQTATYQASGTLANVNGSLRVVSTGSGTLRLSSTAFTLSVGRDLLVEGGTLNISNSAANVCALSLAGSYSQTGGTFNPNANLSFNFNGAGKTFTQSAGTLTSTNINWTLSAGASLTLNNNLTVAAGRSLTVNGTLDAGASQIIAGGAGSTVAINGTLKTADASGFSGSTLTTVSSSSAPSITLGASSTVEYDAAGNQNVTARTDYANLTVSNSRGNNTVTLPSATIALSGDFTLSATFTSGGLNAGASTVVFNGSGQQHYTNSAGATFNNVTVNNPAGLLLNGDLNLGASGVLALAAGIVDARTNGKTVSVTNSAASSVTSAGGYVDGKLQRSIAGPVVSSTAYLFPVGSANGYSPVTNEVTLNPSASTFAVSAAGSYMNGITDTSKAIKRTYTLTSSAAAGTLKGNLTFIYVGGSTGSGGDVSSSVNESTLDAFRRNADGTVNQIPATSRDANSITVNGVGAFSDWTLANTGAAQTLARLSEFRATRYDTGTLLEWKTGFEVDNLGFQIYREERGVRRLVNPTLVAGSALVAGVSVAMTAGNSYSLLDASGAAGARYWLEEMSLEGKSTLYGPFIASRAAGRVPKSIRTPLISTLGDSDSTPDATASTLDTTASTLGAVASISRASGASPTRGEHQWLASDAARAKSPRASDGPARDRQRWLASRASVKILVRRGGWYRVTREQLTAAGLDANADPARLQLYVGGVEVPIHVDDSNWSQTGGAIEFYGEGLDLPSTDTQVYWLVEGDTVGLRTNAPGLRANAVGLHANDAHTNAFVDDDSQAGPSGVTVIEVGPHGGGPGYFNYTIERRERTIYYSGLQNGEAENFYGRVVSSTPVTQTLAVRNLFQFDAPPPTLDVALQGVSAGSHHVSVLFNGGRVGTIDFEGNANKSVDFTLASWMLREGDNEVQLVSSARGDVSLTDHLRLSYLHSLRADGDQLRFNAAAGIVRVGGFSTPDVRVIDVTDPNAPFEVPINADALPDPQGGWCVEVKVAQPSGRELTASTSGRELLAFASAQVSQPAAVVANQPSVWSSDAGQQADMVVITHGSFRRQLEPLVAERTAEGLVVKVVDVEDIFDEFSYGVHTPQAVRDFLEWAKENWSTRPRYVLLVGDGSYDPRDYLGRGAFDLVPSKLIDAGSMETASDDWFADFDDDGIAEMAVGRLPVRTEAEAALVVGKIIGRAHDGAQTSALLVADREGADGYSFEAASDGLQTLVPADVAVSRVNRRSQDAASVRAQIIAGVNAGPLIVNYMGHGSIDVWTGEGLLRGADASALTNGNRLPLFVMMTCLNGYYEGTGQDSLAEALLKAQSGGAFAVWASSGLAEPSAQAQVNDELYRILFKEGAGVRLGDAVRLARGATSDRDVRRTWVFFGDPSSRLR